MAPMFEVVGLCMTLFIRSNEFEVISLEFYSLKVTFVSRLIGSLLDSATASFSKMLLQSCSTITRISRFAIVGTPGRITRILTLTKEWQNCEFKRRNLRRRRNKPFRNYSCSSISLNQTSNHVFTVSCFHFCFMNI